MIYSTRVVLTLFKALSVFLLFTLVDSSETQREFEGKVVLITGASSGIGRAVAFRFAALGARLSLASRNKTELRKIAARCSLESKYKPYIMVVDLTDERNMKRIVDETINVFTRIDVLVNNAGRLERGGIDSTSLDQFDRIFNINVRALYGVTMFAVPHLEKSKGTIINVSSIVGMKPFAGSLSYCMSKSAVDQLTRCLALELGPKRIRINSVNPGLVDTGIHIRGGMSKEAYDKYLKKSPKKNPLKRIATVEDICFAVEFLASNKSSFTSGAVFPIDGARHLC